MGRSIPIPGGLAAAVADGTSTPVQVKNASAFWINTTGATWLAMINNAAAQALTVANATPLAAGLYGPFQLLGGFNTHIHVAGNGGTPTVTVTLTT